MLKEQKICEGALLYRKRIQVLKNLLSHYRQKYSSVAVVCHYYTIEYLSAKNYFESGEPETYIDIKNCTPYYSKLSDLLSVKEENTEIG